MATIYNLLAAFTDWAWGVPMLIWLIGGGIVLTAVTGFIQFRKLGYCLKHTIVDSIRSKSKTSGISGMQAVFSAMSGTIGTGNIVGVGTAIALGGPGAVFWMWCVGLIAMAIKYCEALTAVKFREPAKEGSGYLWNAGPAVYIRKGLPFKTLGKILSAIFAFLMTWNLLMAAPEHTSAITDVVTAAFSIPRYIPIAICVVIAFIVMLGGMKRFVKISELVVPAMSILYILAGIVIICMNIGNIGTVFVDIFRNAFTGTAAIGGFAGATIAQSIRWGMARGMYSSDAGTGIQAIMHGQADVEHPVQQGMWGVFEVFVDTIVICTFTALMILVTGVWESGAEGAQLSLNAFTQSFGTPGKVLLVFCLFMFGITTITGMMMFMERHVTACFGKIPAKILNIVYLFLMVFGGIASFAKVIVITDTCLALSLFINILVLFMMSKGIRESTKDYFENYAVKNEKQKARE